MSLFQRIKNLFSGSTREPKRYSQLFDAMREIQPSTIMEIGTWTGSRAVQMIELAQSLSPGKEISYFGFDLFEELSQKLLDSELSKTPPTLARVQAKLEGTGANIKLIKGNTNDTLPANIEWLPKMDFIFIDGGHSLETIENDWKYASALMHEKTVVIFDDYWQDRLDVCCKKLVDSLDPGIYNVEALPITDTFNNPDWGVISIQFAKVQKRSL